MMRSLTSSSRCPSVSDSRFLGGLYFHNAICRVPSGCGCQASVSLINEPLLKFHKSNPITWSTRAQSALMESSNVWFSHFRSELIWFISAIHVFCLWSCDSGGFRRARVCKGRRERMEYGPGAGLYTYGDRVQAAGRYGKVTFIMIIPLETVDRTAALRSISL